MLINRVSTVLVALNMVCMAETCRADQTVERIIENVKAAESLYDRIDVTITKIYDIGGRAPESENTVSGQDFQFRVVKQPPLYRLDRSGASQAKTGESTLDRISAFDGEVTRVMSGTSYGNVIKKRVEDKTFISPHALVLGRDHPGVPLWAYMSGQEAISAFMTNTISKDTILKTSIVGQADFNGVSCQKVRIEYWRKDVASATIVKEIWLAESRNFLPVRVVSYLPRVSKEIPRAECTVTNLQEIESGVWFPMSLEETVYNKDALEQSREMKVQWHESTVVEQVNIKPDLPKAFFSDIKIPDGTPVYEIENKEIKRKWTQGQGSGLAVAPPLMSRATFIGWNVLLCGVIAVGFFFLRRRFRNSPGA